MKNFLIASAFLIFAGLGLASAASELSETSGAADSICAGTIYNSAGVSTDAICVDAAGTISPIRNLTNNIGSDRVRYKTIFAGDIDIASGIVSVSEELVLFSSNPKGASPAAGFTVSTGSLSTLFNSPTTYIDLNILQTSGAPRNLICYSSNTDSIGAATTTLIMSATFYGWDAKGNWAIENIKFSTTQPVFSTNTFTNAGSPFVLGIGSVAWAYISSFTVQITSMTDSYGIGNTAALMFVGFGQKFGLANGITKVADVYKITLSGGDVTRSDTLPARTINTAFDTISFPYLPPGASASGPVTARVWYHAKTSRP